MAAGGRTGPKPFPPAVRMLLDARDGCCQRCGSARDLHRHHRQLKGTGGSTSSHAQCACNGSWAGEAGPSLRNASAKVNRTTRSSGSGFTGAQSAPAEDPWAAEPGSSGFSDEPPF